MDSLQIVLNHHNTALIDRMKRKIKAEKIVQELLDEFAVFIETVYFFIQNRDEIEVWRKLVNIKPNDIIQKSINEYEDVVKKLRDIKHLIMDTDDMKPITHMLQMMNSVFIINYKDELVGEYLSRSSVKWKTNCCGKTLNCECSNHYSYFSMIEDRTADINTNSCIACRPAWRRSNCDCREHLYNCLICEMKYKIWERLFLRLNSRSYDLSHTRRKKMLSDAWGEYKNYTEEQRQSVGLDEVNRSVTYYEILCAEQNDDAENHESELFEYFNIVDSDDEAQDADDEFERLMNLDRYDVCE